MTQTMNWVLLRSCLQDAHTNSYTDTVTSQNLLSYYDQDRKCRYNVTLRRVSAITVTVERQ